MHKEDINEPFRSIIFPFSPFLPNQHIRSSSPLSLVTRQLIMDERSFSRECVSVSIIPSPSEILSSGDIYRLTFCSKVLSVGSWSMLSILMESSHPSIFYSVVAHYSLQVMRSFMSRQPCHFELSFSFGKVMASNEPNPPLLRLQTQPKILVKCYEFWCYSKMLRSVSCCKCGLYKLQINRTQFHTVQWSKVAAQIVACLLRDVAAVRLVHHCRINREAEATTTWWIMETRIWLWTTMR